KEKLTNIFLLYARAENVLEELIPQNTLENVFIFHPDPWFKTKHYKRRVVNPEFLDLLKPKLVGNAKIYVSTDVFELAEDIKAVFAADSNFKEIQDNAFWQGCYQTHWQVATQNLGRDEYRVVYQFRA
ncbi:MAG: hypothetical protein WC860_03045, partial [Candidatus Margulisiibacteriota bacterium]